jgi:putative endonuclease
MSNKDTGFLGENKAAELIQQKGHIILERNWRYRHLEIDIISSHNGCLHIIEVKTRTSLQFGFPEQHINTTKMQFLKNAAAHFHYLHPAYKRLQFDVVAIYIDHQQKFIIDYFEDVYF